VEKKCWQGQSNPSQYGYPPSTTMAQPQLKRIAYPLIFFHKLTMLSGIKGKMDCYQNFRNVLIDFIHQK
jgi:hypothetical protein